MTPKVSFVVPCYNLAHLLRECLESILTQTYSDLEVLVLDDCSPDDTAEVVSSLPDPRIKYVRNEPNLGHLRNYNKGIALARGDFIWLISPDDYLRKPYALERYVNVMEQNPHLGYVLCPAIKVENGSETELVSWSTHGTTDQILSGHEFLEKLLIGNCVVAPTGMVRRECYDKVTTFPLNMPNSGDWYLWCAFALDYDVGYMAEPMVCYRIHTANMSVILKTNKPRIISDDNIAVRWTVKHMAEARNLKSVVTLCKDAIATYYANLLACDLHQSGIYRMGWDDCERSIRQYAKNEDEELEVRASVLIALADQCYLRRDFTRAREYYHAALQRWCIQTVAKLVLLQLGPVGVYLRDYVGDRRAAFSTRTHDS